MNLPFASECMLHRACVLQIIETAVVVAWSFIGMPKDPEGKPPLMQVGLSLSHSLFFLLLCAFLVLPFLLQVPFCSQRMTTRQ